MKKQKFRNNFIKNLKSNIRKNEKIELKFEKQYLKIRKQYDNSKTYKKLMICYLKMVKIRQYINYLLRMRIELLNLLNDVVR